MRHCVFLVALIYSGACRRDPWAPLGSVVARAAVAAHALCPEASYKVLNSFPKRNCLLAVPKASYGVVSQSEGKVQSRTADVTGFQQLCVLSISA